MNMKKPQIRVTKKDAFAVGKLEGIKETFNEVLEFLNGYPAETPGVSSIRAHVKSRLRYLLTTNIADAFKQKDVK